MSDIEKFTTLQCSNALADCVIPLTLFERVGKWKEAELTTEGQRGLTDDLLVACERAGCKVDKTRLLLGREGINKEIISSSIELLSQLLEQAYDSVTGLARETVIRKRIVREIQRAGDIKEGKLPFLTYILFDVDQLHEKNELYGQDQVNRGYHELARLIYDKLREQQLTKPCFLFRRETTGDEIPLILVGGSKEEGQRLNSLFAKIDEVREWPIVMLENKQTGKKETVTMSARHAIAYSDEVVLPPERDRIGLMLEGLHHTAEERIGASQRRQ